MVSIPYFAQKTQYGCGPACFMMAYCTRKGIKNTLLTEQKLLRKFGVTVDHDPGFLWWGGDSFNRAAAAYGMTLDQKACYAGHEHSVLLSFFLGGDFLILRCCVDDQYHFRLVYGYDGTTVSYHDPDTGRDQQMESVAFLREWRGGGSQFIEFIR